MTYQFELLQNSGMSQAFRATEITRELVLKFKPESFLDLGVGSGKWGFLFREYTDIWEGRALTRQWKSQIDGIEIYAPLVQDYQRAMYKRIFVGNAYTLIDELHSYDFVWCFDLLASFEKQKGLQMIKKMREKTGMLLGIWQALDEKAPAEALGENPYEAKVSSWSLEDFSRADFRYYRIFENGREREVFAIYTEEDLSGLGFSKFKR